MPVLCSESMVRIKDPAFRSLDWEVTGCAFESHRAIGNLVREEGYKNDLIQRVTEKGIKIQPEIPFQVTYGSFSRWFPCDLLVENAVIYECKTVSAFNPRHRAQLLQYLFLADIQFGKLLNFATPSLKFEFVSSRQRLADRQMVEINIDNWDAPCTEPPLDEILSELIRDWGAGLTQVLYEDALLHFLGTRQLKKTDVILKRDGKTLCRQPELLFQDNSMLHLSSYSDPNGLKSSSLLKFKDHAGLKAIHWVNFSLKEITLTSL